MTNQYALGYKAGLEAAVKVCEDKHDYMCSRAAEAIAALPVPEVQWRDLTDEDKQQLQDYWRSHKGKHHEMTDFDVTSIVCDSVIAKFKEKQL